VTVVGCSSLALRLAAASLLACTPASVATTGVVVPCAPPVAVAARSPPPAAPARGDVYLPPESAGGSALCFDPDSQALRAFIERPPVQEGTVFDTAALAADIGDLHGAMKKLYAGYPELLESPSFDVDAFFAGWQRDVLARGPTVTFADGVLTPLVALRHHVRDNHLSVSGWGGKLRHRDDLAFSE